MRGGVPAGQRSQVVREPRVAGLHRAEPGDQAALARARREGGHRGRHGHPVVTAAVEAGAAQWTTDARDRQRVTLDRGGGAEGLDHVRHRGQPVHLLHPQLTDIGEDRHTLGDGSGHGKRGDLVQRRDLAGAVPRSRAGGRPPP